MGLIPILNPGDPNNAHLPHVLLVVDQFPKALGGGERIALKIAELLPRYGYRASILTFAVHPECEAIRSPSCPLYLLPLRRTYDMNAFRAALRLKSFLHEQKIRIVQTFFESSDLWAALVTRATSQAKLIWSRRDMGILRSGKHRVAYRLMAHLPDAVFAVSEQVRQNCIAADRVPADRVQTIYNGLDLAEWADVPRPSRVAGEVVITTVGNIRRVKGHDILIQAAALVVRRFPQASFRILGDVLEPDYFMELQALVRDLDVSANVHFAGVTSSPRTHLAQSDIFVLPSRSEGFSNAIVEAMATSLPVVATNVGGNAEAVEHGGSGLLVEVEDPSALANAVLHLIRNPSLAKLMGARGRTIVVEKFTTDFMMNSIAGAYGDLLAGGLRGRRAGA